MFKEKDPTKIAWDYDTKNLLRKKAKREREAHQQLLYQQQPPPMAQVGSKRPLDLSPGSATQPAKQRAAGEDTPSYAVAAGSDNKASNSPLSPSTSGPLYAGVVAPDGKTSIDPVNFKKLVKELGKAFGVLSAKGEPVPVTVAMFPTGLRRAGVDFRGWELADERSLELMDQLVQKTSSKEFMVLPTKKIRENNKKDKVYRAPLGKVGDDNNFMVSLDDDELKEAVDQNRKNHGVTGKLEFLQASDQEGTRYLMIGLDEEGLASLRRNQYRLQLSIYGIVTFEPHNPSARSSRRGSKDSGQSNTPADADTALAEAAASALAITTPIPNPTPMEEKSPESANPPRGNQTQAADPIRRLSTPERDASRAANQARKDRDEFDGVEVESVTFSDPEGSQASSDTEGNQAPGGAEQGGETKQDQATRKGP